jgi:hypothetical protein
LEIAAPRPHAARTGPGQGRGRQEKLLRSVNLEGRTGRTGEARTARTAERRGARVVAVVAEPVRGLADAVKAEQIV